ncbi:MAG: DNA mismatch repair protein MutL, partial [Chitinophagales bacterium]|nr:DNA mismatch repair protein MutL [Chitinophagales bacterium]
HATSKISTIDDLFAIRTMGFRGEAMASIAAIAQVELKSKRREDALGTLIEIECAKVRKQEPTQAADGTSIAIKNLFHNVPARRNFLKANSVETRHIIDEFQRIALSNPAVHFELHHNAMQVFHLTAGNLRQRIVSIFGNQYNERLVPVEEQTNIVDIFGFIGKPDTAKKTRGEQFFFVNRRFIRNNYLNHAVINAYEQLLQKDSFPLYILFIDIDPSRIDINVHPTKQEIKFEDDRIVYAFVNAAVKRGLSKYSITPSLDFDRETAFDRLEAFSMPANSSATAELTTFPAKEKIINRPKEDTSQRSNLRNWEQLYEIGRKQDVQILTVQSEPEKDEIQQQAGMENFSEWENAPFQLHNQFIVCQIKSGFILINQQAAHERILYEKYSSGLEDHNLTTQQQLFPETLHISAGDVELLRELLPEFSALGFDIQEFGGNSFVVHGIPPDVKDGNQRELIEQMLDEFKKSQSNIKLGKRHQLALSMAKKASIKNGEVLSEKELKNLIDQLFACQTPYFTPEGNHTVITFHLNDIEKLFQKSQE